MPVARVFNEGPRAGLTLGTPTGRVEKTTVLTPGTDTTIYAGTPIGLLLALTYAFEVIVSTPATYKTSPPYASIRNTD